MKLTRVSLDALRVGFETRFDQAFTQVPNLRDRVSELLTSTSGESLYGWLGELPGMREWIGPRVVHGLGEHDYRLRNRDFELTVAVERNHIEDDTLDTYGKRFEVMGRSAARWREDLVWDALAAGFTAEGYDGQPFFDTDHPVLDAEGRVTTYANTDGGAGPAWYLMATTGLVKPIILQERKAPEFVYRDDQKDDNVFFNKQFIYGVDARGAAGYSFPQLAWGSRQPLTDANYAKARTAIMNMKADYGRPLAIVPDLLVVPPTLESEARRVLKRETVDGGDTNVWKDTAEILVVPYLAGA